MVELRRHLHLETRKGKTGATIELQVKGGNFGLEATAWGGDEEVSDIHSLGN